MTFSHIYSIVITVVLMVIIHLFRKNKEQQRKNVAEAEKRTKEVADELKRSSDKKLTDSERDAMHKRMGGQRIQPPN